MLLSGCVIGDVDGDGGATTADATREAPVDATQDAAPDPTTSGDAAGARVEQDLELPAEVTGLGEMSVAVLDFVGGDGDGDLRFGGAGDVTDSAWSTSKVPLSVAALRQDSSPAVVAQVEQAITESDNAAADALWASLGDPATAASAVQDVLAEAGDTTTVESRKVRPEFSAYGQTQWSLGDQTRFAAELHCLDGAGPVSDAMGRIAEGQNYGLGTFAGAQYKGGWGPGADGRYLVRQFGLVPAQDGTMVPVALAAVPADGSYESGQSALTAVTDALRGEIEGATGVGDRTTCTAADLTRSSTKLRPRGTKDSTLEAPGDACRRIQEPDEPLGRRGAPARCPVRHRVPQRTVRGPGR